MKIEMNGQAEYKVENKPVPRHNVRRDRSTKYPFDKMKVGQSFFIPEPAFRDVSRIRASASSYGKRHGVKFAIVRDGEGYRCGRIE
jgi:hypothetical protein